MSNDADESDLFGRAISLDDGSLLVGAPGKHLEVPEIQLVVSTGSSTEVSNTRKHSLQYTRILNSDSLLLSHVRV